MFGEMEKPKWETFCRNMITIYPAEGGPHMVMVTTDEGVRYSDGTLLETTASLEDKVQ